MFLNLSWGTQQQVSSWGGKRGRPERRRRYNNSNRGRRREEARAEALHSQEEGHPKKKAQDRSDTETEAAQREAGPSQSHYKKGHMTKLYLTDSEKEAIVNFVKNHKELYNKTSEHFKDKARKEFPIIIPLPMPFTRGTGSDLLIHF